MLLSKLMYEYKFTKPESPPEIPEISNEAILEVFSLDDPSLAELKNANRESQELLYESIGYLVYQYPTKDEDLFNQAFEVVDLFCLTLKQQATMTSSKKPDAVEASQFIFPTVTVEACQRFFIKQMNDFRVDVDKYGILRIKQPALIDLIESNTDLLSDPKTKDLFKKVLGWSFEIIEQQVLLDSVY